MSECFVCHDTFESNEELAKHIIGAKKGHFKSKKWASSFLLRVNQLNQQRDLPQRSTMTDEEREKLRDAKQETQIPLSGKVSRELCMCPFCKSTHYTTLPIEYLELPYLWRSQKGTIVRSCNSCESDRRR